MKKTIEEWLVKTNHLYILQNLFSFACNIIGNHSSFLLPGLIMHFTNRFSIVVLETFAFSSSYAQKQYPILYSAFHLLVVKCT
jgi:hypothetical protein